VSAITAKDKNMSTTSSTANASWIGRLAAPNAKPAGIVRHMVHAFFAWREQRRAAAELRSWSVRDLKDIGLTPGEIDLAVRGEIWRGDRPSVSEYLTAIDDRSRPTWSRLYRNH